MLVNFIGALQRTPDYTSSMLRSFNNALSRIPVLAISITAELIDFLVVQVAALAANSALQEGSGMLLVGIFGANAVGVACFFSFRHGGLYEIIAIRNDKRVIRAIFVRWSVLCLLLTASAVFLHHSGEIGRFWIILFYGVGLVGFTVERLILASLVRSWLAQGNYVHAIAIVGKGELALHLADLLADNMPGLKFVGLFGHHTPADIESSYTITELLELARQDSVDTVIIAEPDLSSDRLHRLVQQLRQQPLCIYLMPSSIALESLKRSWQNGLVFPGPNLFPLADRPINETSLFIKSVFDKLVAFVLIILLAPVMLACAAGIRLSGPGPIFFRQKRIGYKGRDFMIFKFRTMYLSAHPHVKLTEKNDPRIFRFGMFLRKTSLDELPQLFNVLKGEMSLVGPRPHMPQASAAGRLYYEAVSDYATRHRVKPGITGWAQVNGWRGPTETIDQIRARVLHDLYYIENWSLFLDFLIMFRTCFVLFGKNVF